ncbi:hypothetical protein GGR57DRAFT_342909 [Xylariaceae sp. FL1272]|nr:hypothetical protein GGR57DRAFT_342909 [Xylariaceae sp. FL1272]
MARLPDGWESDYDGTRWFYRYKATGTVQYHFPQPGDEYAEFFLDDGSGPLELTPEESLAIERQAKRRSGMGGETETTSDTTRSESKRDNKKIEAIGEKDSNGMSATGYFDPSSFMFSGGYSDISPMDNDSPRLDSVLTTTNTHPTAAELPEGDRQMWSPVGFVAELATQDTIKCAEELAPVELDAASFAPASIQTNITQNAPTELPTHRSPVEEKAPEPKWTPPTAQPVGSYPLVSASFSFPPLKDSSATSQDVPSTGQGTTDKPSHEPQPVGNGQNRYHPWNPIHEVAQQEAQIPGGRSGILAQTTILENQNSELGGIERMNSGDNPTTANPVDVPSALAPALGPKTSSPTPSPLMTQHPAVLQPSEKSHQRPIPGTAARHESISISAQGLTYAPSILKPGGRRQSTNLSDSITPEKVEPPQDVISMPTPDRFHTPGPHGQLGATRVNTLPSNLSSNDSTLPPRKTGGPGFLFFHEITSPPSLTSPDSATMSHGNMPPKPETQSHGQSTNSSSRPSSQTPINTNEAYPSVAPLNFVKRHSSKGSQTSSHLSEDVESASSLDKPCSMSFDDISEAISVISNDFTPHGTPTPISSPSQPPPQAHPEITSIQGEGPADNRPTPGSGSQPLGQAPSPPKPNHGNAAPGNFASAQGLNSSPSMAGSGDVVTASSLVRPPGNISNSVAQVSPAHHQASSTPHNTTQSSQHAIHHGVSYHPGMQAKPEHNGLVAAQPSLQSQPSSHPSPNGLQGHAHSGLESQASVQPYGQSSQGAISTVGSHASSNSQNTQQAAATAIPSPQAAVRPPGGQQIQESGPGQISPQLQQPSPMTQPVSPLQSQVSSPAQSIVSLHMSHPTPSSTNVQPPGNATTAANVGTNLNPSQINPAPPRPSSIPPHMMAQQMAGNRPPSNTQTQSPTSNGFAAGHSSPTQIPTPALPPKPYPMLPGQVTPLPSQLSSTPIPMSVQSQSSQNTTQPTMHTAQQLMQTGSMSTNSHLSGQQPQMGMALSPNPGGPPLSHRPPRKPVASQVAGGLQHNSQVANSPQQANSGHQPFVSQPQYQPVVNNQPAQPALSQQSPNYQQPATASQAPGSQTAQPQSAADTPAPGQQMFAAPPAAQGQQPVQGPNNSSPSFQYAGKPFNSAQTTAALKDAGKGVKKWGKKMLKSPGVKQATAAISGAIISESMGGSAGGGALLGSKIYSTFQQRPQVAHAQTAPPQANGIPQQPVPSLTQPSQILSQVPGQMPGQMHTLQFQPGQPPKPGQVQAVQGQGQVLPQQSAIPQPGQLPTGRPPSVAAQSGVPQPAQQAGQPQSAHMQSMQTTQGQHQHLQPQPNYHQPGHPQQSKPQAGPQHMAATQSGYLQIQQQQQALAQGNQQQPQLQQGQPQWAALPSQQTPSQQIQNQQSQPIRPQASQPGYPQPGQMQPAQVQPGRPQQTPAQPLNPPITASQLAAQQVRPQPGYQPAGVQTPGRPPVVQNPALASGVAANFTAQAQINGNVQQQYPMPTAMAGAMSGQPPMAQFQPERPGATIGVDSNGGVTAQTQTNMNPGLVLGTAFLGNIINNAIRTNGTSGNNQGHNQGYSQGNNQGQNESYGGGYESHGAPHDSNNYGSNQESYFGQQQPISYNDQTYATENTTYVNNTTYVVDNSTMVNTDTTYATDINVNSSLDMNSMTYTDTSMTSFDNVQAINITSSSDWTSSTDYSGGGWGDFEF